MYKQVAPIEETETLISIDYEDKKMYLYTTKCTIMNRLSKMGYKPSKEIKDHEGNIHGCEYVFPTKDIGKFLRTSIFKFN